MYRIYLLSHLFAHLSESTGYSVFSLYCEGKQPALSHIGFLCKPQEHTTTYRQGLVITGLPLFHKDTQLSPLATVQGLLGSGHRSHAIFESANLVDLLDRWIFFF